MFRWFKKPWRPAAPMADGHVRPANGIDYNIPVLCYHSWNIAGREYEKNDHIALESDLHELARRGYAIASLDFIADILMGKPGPWNGARKLAGISFDDGRDFDYHDFTHPAFGRIESFHTTLVKSEEWLPPLGHGARATAFVIASPEAREILDVKCGDGRGEWQDDWWKDCAGKGMIDIANHGWDHVHVELPRVRQKDNIKGSFHEISSFADAEGQISEAQNYINQMTNGQNVHLFGYPYGHASAYLKDAYFPEHSKRIGLRAAFGTGGESVRPDCSLWNIPRFVFGWHWNTPASFTALLDAVERGEL